VAETTIDSRPTVCVDLDGVLNLFDRWVSPEHFHAPRPGAREFLSVLRARGYRVVVLTVRWHEWVSRWLQENGMSDFVDEVTDRKPPAVAYIDDRAVCFRGDFEDTLQAVASFRPFWEEAAAEAN